MKPGSRMNRVKRTSVSDTIFWSVVPRLNNLFSRLGRVEKAFLVLLLFYLAFAIWSPASGFAALINVLLYALGIIVAFRLARRGIVSVIWRLRNRLIVTYLFIAVVPIALVFTLAAISLYGFSGQVAVYLVASELERRTALLVGPGHYILSTPAPERLRVVTDIAPFLNAQFPNMEVLVSGSGGALRYPPTSTLSTAPNLSRDAHGVLAKEGRLYAWAHAVDHGNTITLLAPLTHGVLSDLVPRLGDVSFLSYAFIYGNGRPADGASSARVDETPVITDEHPTHARRRVPEAANAADIQVNWTSPVQVSPWTQPERTDERLVYVMTRPSAVLGIVFGQSALRWYQGVVLLFVLIVSLFLIVELVSLVIGVSLTRTVTRAVHGLYEGTQRVREGDFSHRIAVRGNDQLGELALSFNIMTENLQRLIQVEKEKQRLQSELEIAREVQNQLFPKNAPTMRELELTGLCNPARMVSGDYYDFMCVRDSALALAIGDVAGKGISAALLMAAIQSIMRTQLSAGLPAVAAAGNGSSQPSLSTAYLVSQLNRQLYDNTSPEKYATFYFGVYDQSNGVLTYTNAGHLPPILVRDGSVETLEVTGTVVGAFPFANYEEQRIALNSGDLLVAYTDGIVEPENEYGEMFGDDRLKDMLVKYSTEETRGLINRVMEAVMQWTGSSELQDDMTVLVLRKL
jgi:sigma-B regulation protein RsbU (phosphoserine phosphatase)